MANLCPGSAESLQRITLPLVRLVFIMPPVLFFTISCIPQISVVKVGTQCSIASNRTVVFASCAEVIIWRCAFFRYFSTSSLGIVLIKVTKSRSQLSLIILFPPNQTINMVFFYTSLFRYPILLQSHQIHIASYCLPENICLFVNL